MAEPWLSNSANSLTGGIKKGYGDQGVGDNSTLPLSRCKGSDKADESRIPQYQRTCSKTRNRLVATSGRMARAGLNWLLAGSALHCNTAGCHGYELSGSRIASRAPEVELRGPYVRMCYR